MKPCPYCSEKILDAAIKCRYCGAMLENGGLPTEWHRVRQNRKLAGVCAGLAVHFGVSVTALRLAFVVLALVGFPIGILIYLALWVIMPLRPDARVDYGSTDVVAGEKRLRR